MAKFLHRLFHSSYPSFSQHLILFDVSNVYQLTAECNNQVHVLVSGHQQSCAGVSGAGDIKLPVFVLGGERRAPLISCTVGVIRLITDMIFTCWSPH